MVLKHHFSRWCPIYTQCIRINGQFYFKLSPKIKKYQYIVYFFQNGFPPKCWGKYNTYAIMRSRVHTGWVTVASVFKLSCAGPKCLRLLLDDGAYSYLGSLPHVHVWKTLLHWSSCLQFSLPALLTSVLSRQVRSVPEWALPSPLLQRPSSLLYHLAQGCVVQGCGMLFLRKLPQL